MFSVDDSHKIKYSGWKSCLGKAEFEKNWINGDRDLLNKKNPVRVLGRQWKVASVKEEVYFRLPHSQELDAGVHHLIECKRFLDI